MNGEKSEHNHQNSEQDGCPPIVGGGKNQAQKDKHSENVRRYSVLILGWFKKFNEPLTIVTLLLFGATLALYCATRDLVEDASHNAERQLRAYVLLDGEGSSLARGNEDGGWGCKFRIKNYGQTPAYKIRYAARFEILPYPYAEKSAFSRYPVDIDASKGTENLAIQASSFGQVAGTRKFNADEIIETLNKTEARYYCFGIIKYFDVFKQERTTEFCVSFQRNVSSQVLREIFRGNPSVPADRAFLAQNCAHDNEVK